jgi:hypothetical protein
MKKTTAAIDAGYDALNIDDYPNDMYFVNNDNQLVIQGGYLIKCILSIRRKTDAEGKATFNLDQAENFDSKQRFFIYDKLTDTYHNITTAPYKGTTKLGLLKIVSICASDGKH